LQRQEACRLVLHDIGNRNVSAGFHGSPKGVVTKINNAAVIVEMGITNTAVMGRTLTGTTADVGITSVSSQNQKVTFLWQ